MGGGHIWRDLLGHADRRPVVQQVRDRGIAGIARVREARAQRIAVQRQQLEPGFGVHEPRQPAQPGELRERRPGHGRRGDRGPPPRELLDESFQVVAVAAGEEHAAVAVPVPGEQPVDIGLVADLEGLDRASPHPGQQRPRLGGRDRGPSTGQVHAHDHPRPERLGQRVGGPHPAVVQAVGDPTGRDLPADQSLQFFAALEVGQALVHAHQRLNAVDV